MTPDELSHRFQRRFAEQGYRVAPSVPMRDADDSLTFVNASVTPFKSAMLAGIPIPRTANVQTCFRAHGISSGLIVFRMLGVIAPIDDLDRVTRDMLDFLCAEAGLSRSDLAAVSPRGHGGLERAATAAGCEVVLVAENETRFGTTWGYGSGDLLVGHGLTVAWRTPYSEPCSPHCHVHCGCPRMVGLGNIIIIDVAGQPSYVEVGFGLEWLACQRLGGELFALPELARRVAAARAIGFAEEEARALTNLALGVSALVAEGAQPGHKWSAHVLRSLMRQLADRVLNGASVATFVEQTLRLLQRLDMSQAATAIVHAELELYRSSIVAALPRARRVIARHSGGARGLLRESYGLPAPVIERLLAGAAEL